MKQELTFIQGTLQLRITMENLCCFPVVDYRQITLQYLLMSVCFADVLVRIVWHLEGHALKHYQITNKELFPYYMTVVDIINTQPF